jgi:parallel beta-helix repeat protein
VKGDSDEDALGGAVLVARVGGRDDDRPGVGAERRLCRHVGNPPGHVGHDAHQDHVGDIWFVADNVTLDLAGDAFTRTREDFGILLVGSSQNAFVANTVDLSTAEGILLDGASNGNIFQANAVLRSGGGGVTVLGSSSNSIIENRVMFNRAGGISLLAGSSDNVVRRNISCRNGNVDAYDDLTGTGNVWGMSRFCTSQNI